MNTKLEITNTQTVVAGMNPKVRFYFSDNQEVEVRNDGRSWDEVTKEHQKLMTIFFNS